jgi:hypothetical protein
MAIEVGIVVFKISACADTFRHTRDPHDRDQLDRFVGRRHRRHEYHAHFRDRAHAGDWRTQGYRRSPSGRTFAVPAGSRGPHPGRRHNRHLNRVRHIHIGACSRAFDSRNAVFQIAIPKEKAARANGGHDLHVGSGLADVCRVHPRRKSCEKVSARAEGLHFVLHELVQTLNICGCRLVSGSPSAWACSSAIIRQTWRPISTPSIACGTSKDPTRLNCRASVALKIFSVFAAALWMRRKVPQSRAVFTEDSAGSNP